MAHPNSTTIVVDFPSHAFATLHTTIGLHDGLAAHVMAQTGMSSPSYLVEFELGSWTTSHEFTWDHTAKSSPRVFFYARRFYVFSAYESLLQSTNDDAHRLFHLYFCDALSLADNFPDELKSLVPGCEYRPGMGYHMSCLPSHVVQHRLQFLHAVHRWVTTSYFTFAELNHHGDFGAEVSSWCIESDTLHVKTKSGAEIRISVPSMRDRLAHHILCRYAFGCLCGNTNTNTNASSWKNILERIAVTLELTHPDEIRKGLSSVPRSSPSSSSAAASPSLASPDSNSSDSASKARKHPAGLAGRNPSFSETLSKKDDALDEILRRRRERAGGE
jgi:hypothetical protein